MIDIEELRIGNLVDIRYEHEFMVHPVKIIDIDAINKTVEIDDSGRRREVNLHKIIPIPINLYILEKLCGFKKSFNLLKGNDEKWCHEKYNFHIRLRDGHYKIVREINSSPTGEWIDVEFGKDGCMDFLHQLQNVIRDMTGEELSKPDRLL